jgi:hypothetical protein
MLKPAHEYRIYGTTDLISRHLDICSNNQYLYVEVENGSIRRVKKQSRVLGYVTLGLSLLFTSPYILVTGTEDVRNRDCLQRIEGSVTCTVLFSPMEDEGQSTDV